MALPDRMGNYAYSHMCDQLTDAIRTALDHGVTVKEFVLCVQEGWDIELYDRRKHDNAEFNRILADGKLV
jgi:hypothetical protein